MFGPWGRSPDLAMTHAPGVFLACTVAAAGSFAGSRFGAPPVLVALLLGMILSDLGRDGRYAPGVRFASRTMLRAAVVLLGATISLANLASVGWGGVLLAIGALALTLAAGFGFGLLLGLKPAHAAITAAAVSICGAAAAGAVASAMPNEDGRDTRTATTVAWISIVGAVAMWFYPRVASYFSLDPRQTAIFIGGSVHEVAQVIGSSYGVSDAVGQMATAIKLVRVACLAPVVTLMVALFAREGAKTGAGAAAGTRPPMLPWFVAGFVILAIAANIGVLPAPVRQDSGTVARTLMLAAFAAMGLNISLGDLFKGGGRSLAAILFPTVLLAAIILGCLVLLPV